MSLLSRLCEPDSHDPERQPKRWYLSVGLCSLPRRVYDASDAGIPQLSMHSVRATTGSLDPGLGAKFYKGFLDHWEEVDSEWVA